MIAKSIGMCIVSITTSIRTIKKKRSFLEFSGGEMLLTQDEDEKFD